ncbi:Apolipoprotein N-acyltransferase [Thiorhodovibrio winogradskyi]|uniref:Apolipoprotein N-acyltransferase n=1 Tax=Thiorhodovibrio winogradskyi TaxID=77007 RepID=A0ABZ0S5M1_9GAMM|nr:apolipoprotein N-acyltransferase [Thiorhodovibrio winogradskyi]
MASPWCWLLAPIAGAATVLAFAPFGWYPLGILALVLWYQCLRGRTGRDAFVHGWLYGAGLLGVGVAWIRISLNEFGNLPAVAANGMMLLFVAAMALYYGLAGWLIGRVQPVLQRFDWAGPMLLLPAVWVLSEWLRSWVLTGFPWLLLGNTQVDSPLAGWAPILGVHGLSLLAALSAGLLWLSVARCRARPAALIVLAVIWAGGGLLRMIDWTQPSGEPFTAVLVQANIAPSLKWQPEALEPNLEAHLAFTRQHLGVGLIVWPETAIPSFLHEVRLSLIEPLAERARAEGSEILIGVPIMEGDRRYYNGLLSIGTAEDSYYKRHLVPFGEYLPLRALIGPLVDWFDVPMSSFSPGRAEQPLLRVGPHHAGASICYEDVFPDQVRQALPAADYLVNVSNDAWFGDSLAPAQHLEFARLRALENGRYLVRATNTGISAIIDQKGRLTAVLPAFERGALVGEVRPFSGETPFSRLGSLVPISLALIMLLASLLLGRLGRRA